MRVESPCERLERVQSTKKVALGRQTCIIDSAHARHTHRSDNRPFPTEPHTPSPLSPSRPLTHPERRRMRCGATAHARRCCAEAGAPFGRGSPLQSGTTPRSGTTLRSCIFDSADSGHSAPQIRGSGQLRWPSCSPRTPGALAGTSVPLRAVRSSPWCAGGAAAAAAAAEHLVSTARLTQRSVPPSAS